MTGLRQACTWCQMVDTRAHLFYRHAPAHARCIRRRAGYGLDGEIQPDESIGETRLSPLSMRVPLLRYKVFATMMLSPWRQSNQSSSTSGKPATRSGTWLFWTDTHPQRAREQFAGRHSSSAQRVQGCVWRTQKIAATSSVRPCHYTG